VRTVQRVRVATYNAMLLPAPAASNAEQRARRIGMELGGAVRSGFLDVVALQEVVEPSAVAALLEEARFPWCAAPLVKGMMRMNGGVMLAARTPPFLVRHYVFRTCDDYAWDSLIAKGVVHAAWHGPHGDIHVYATHVQSSLSQQDVREQQIAEMRAWIDAHEYGPDDVVLLAGDFNLALDDELQRSVLGVADTVWALPDTGKHSRKTWDTWTDDGPLDLLDGVLVHARHRGACDARSRVLRVAKQSDHNAVMTTLTFEDATSRTPPSRGSARAPPSAPLASGT